MLCVTLFREDVQELMHIFAANCQYVEVFIDGQVIVAPSQLEAFPPEYRASSLLMRGYYPQLTERGTELRLIQLRMGRMITKLIGHRWNESALNAPPIMREIRTVLDRNQRSLQNTMLSLTFKLMLCLFPYAFMGASNFLNGSVTFIVIILFSIWIAAFGMLNLYSFHGLLHLVRANRYIYLLPGTMRTNRSYGWQEVGATLLLAIAYGCFLLVLALVAAQWFRMQVH